MSRPRGRRRTPEEHGPSGFLVVDKPVGWTSHDVVDAARGWFSARRVGHLGTLDPNATGVLPLAVRSATKLIEHIQDRGKSYQGCIRLGIETDTLDAAGRVLRRHAGALPEEAVVRAAIRRSGRGVRGFVGRHAQVRKAGHVLGLAEAETKMDSKEHLFSLELSEMQVPLALQDGSLIARHPMASDVPWLIDWLVDYAVEALGNTDGPDLRAKLRQNLGEADHWSAKWILEAHGLPVSFTAFNAQTPDCVQVGGVWTPPAQRCNSYARAAAAAILLEAEAVGVSRSILFTDTHNHAAQACYRGLGFQRVGDYAICLLNEEHRIE